MEDEKGGFMVMVLAKVEADLKGGKVVDESRLRGAVWVWVRVWAVARSYFLVQLFH